jgi:hypothetical protein
MLSWNMPAWNDRTRLRQLVLVPAITASIVLTTSERVFADVACKPMLSFRNVREVRQPIPPIVPWTWRATIAVDASFCATRSGAFEIDFVRIKEYSPDLQFTERFRWNTGQFEVSLELAHDESILEYRIGFIAPCVCREFPGAD